MLEPVQPVVVHHKRQDIGPFAGRGKAEVLAGPGLHGLGYGDDGKDDDEEAPSIKIRGKSTVEPSADEKQADDEDDDDEELIADDDVEADLDKILKNKLREMADERPPV